MRPYPAARLFRVLASFVPACVLAACGGGPGIVDPASSQEPPPASASLKYFEGDDACAALERHVEERAEVMMKDQLGRWRDRRGPQPLPLPAPAEGGATPVADTGAPAASPAPTAYSTTNVQVAGVDEFDTIVNDARHLYALKAADDQLVLSKVRLWPADSLALLGQARWASGGAATGRQMPVGITRLDATRLMTLTTGSPAVVPLSEPMAPGVGATMVCIDGACGGLPGEWTPPRTVVQAFDVAADSAPVAGWSAVLPGRLVGARRIGERIHAVTVTDLTMPDGVRWWPAGLDWTASEARWRAAFDALIDANRAAIRAATLGQWLAPLSVDNQPVVPTPAQCRDFARVDVPTRLAWLRVHTIDVDARTIRHETVLAEGAQVAMSTKALYVGTTWWRQDDSIGIGTATYLHRFALEPAGRARYEGSGALTGSMLGPYALDEDATGIVRVAMSDVEPDGRPISYLATLRPAPGTWTPVGRSEPIAPGETLQSVRFVGERAYLVTFRQVDPFFVFDLSDPARPSRVGELKLPGFSTYLHPADGSHLIGIGYDEGGWPRRIKASLFDVGDPAAPREQSGLVLGDIYAGSEALWDPHAFTWLPPTSADGDALMAVPLRSFEAVSWGVPRRSQVRLARFHPQRGLTDAGSLTMPAPATDSPWEDYARRAVLIEDTVFGYSDIAVRAARIADPAVPVATITLP